MTIEWAGNSKTVSFPIRVNNGMGADAIIGKAYRKSYAWLYRTLTGQAIPDGDADDNTPIDIRAEVVSGSATQQPAKSVSPIADATKARRRQEPEAKTESSALESAIYEKGIPVSVEEVRAWNAKRTSPYDDAALVANINIIANQIADQKAI